MITTVYRADVSLILDHEFTCACGIIDHRFYFAAVAYDPFIFEQPINVALSEARYAVEIKIAECGTEIIAFGKNSSPAQSGLEALQAQFLEQAAIIVHRETPFGIVVREKLRRCVAPAAAWFAIRTHYR